MFSTLDRNDTLFSNVFQLSCSKHTHWYRKMNNESNRCIKMDKKNEWHIIPSFITF